MSATDVRDQINRQQGLLAQTAQSVQEAKARLDELLAYQVVHNQVKWYMQDSLMLDRSRVMQPGIDPASVKVLVGMTEFMNGLLAQGDTHFERLEEQSYVIAGAIARAEEELSDLGRLQVIQAQGLQELRTQLTIDEQNERSNV